MIRQKLDRQCRAIKGELKHGVEAEHASVEVIDPELLFFQQLSHCPHLVVHADHSGEHLQDAMVI